VNVPSLALVIAGAIGAWLIVRVKLCVEFTPTPLAAVNVIGYVPTALPLAVPLSIPVAVLNEIPAGNAPDSVIAGCGEPEAVTVKDPSVPAVNETLPPLVIKGT
jgi:hypothetical protein